MAKLPLMFPINFSLIKYNSQATADNNFIVHRTIEFTIIPLHIDTMFNFFR